MVRLPSHEEIEEAKKRAHSFSISSWIEGYSWGCPTRQRGTPPPLEELANYLRDGGRFTREIRAWLVEAMSTDGGGEYIIKIQRRRKGAPKFGNNRKYKIGQFIIESIEIQRFAYLLEDKPKSISIESAVAAAMGKYHVTRSAAFTALRFAREIDDPTKAHPGDDDPIILDSDVDESDTEKEEE